MWTSHQVTLLNEMSSVGSDAMKNLRTSLLNEATMELQRNQRHSHELQEYQQGVRRHVSEVQQEVQGCEAVSC